MEHRKQGVLFTVLSALLFGITPIWASLSYDLGSTPETLTFYRNLLVVPILFVILLIQKKSFALPPATLATLLAVGVLGRGLTTLLLYSSYPYVGVGMATCLHFVYPVFTALICRFLFREKLGARKVVALLLATAGVVCFVERGQSAGAGIGIALAVISAFTYAAYMVGLDKLGLSKLDPMLVSFYMAIGVSCGMFLYNIPTRHINFFLPVDAFLLTALIAVSTSLLAVSLLQMGVRYLNAPTAAILSLFEPVTSAVCSVLLLNEAFSLAKLVGSLLILVAILLLVLVRPGDSVPEETT